MIEDVMTGAARIPLRPSGRIAGISEFLELAVESALTICVRGITASPPSRKMRDSPASELPERMSDAFRALCVYVGAMFRQPAPHRANLPTLSANRQSRLAAATILFLFALTGGTREARAIFRRWTRIQNRMNFGVKAIE